LLQAKEMARRPEHPGVDRCTDWIPAEGSRFVPAGEMAYCLQKLIGDDKILCQYFS
jgi:hypothetical protein